MACLPQRDDNCANEDCAPGLVCDIARYSGSVPVASMNTCHQRCDPGDSASCSGGERCLPSMVNLNIARYELQLAGGQNVACSADAGNAECDTAGGYRCENFTAGRRCARPMSSCGTPVAPFDLTRTSPARAGEFCNYGSPTFIPELGITVPGSQYCDNYPALAAPPRVFCDQLANMTVGVCVALCSIPLNDGGAELLDCPSGHACDLGVTNVWRAASPLVPCDAGTTCDSPAGTSCYGPFGLPDGGTSHLCGWRYGSCQPL